MLKMKPLFALLCTLLVSYGTNSLFAQGPIIDTEIMATQATKLGKTPPLMELMDIPATDKAKQDAAKANKPGEIFNFYGRGQMPEPVNPDALPKGKDAVVQSETNRSGDFIVEPVVDIQGMDALDFGGWPPDPCGTVGRDYYIQMINGTYFQIFNKDGSAATTNISVNTIWASVGISGAGDPIILYDQEVDRWLLTEFSPMGPDQLLMAISETDDPTGSWIAYEFTAPNFPDYPKYGIWSNAFVVTTNESFSTMPFYVIDRQAMLAGEEAVAIQRLTVPKLTFGPFFQVLTPVDWDGPMAPPEGANPMFLRMNDDAWSSSSQDRVDLYEVEIDFENSSNTQIIGPKAINLSPFDTNPCAAPGADFACIPQPNGQGIDGQPGIIMHRVQYRNFGTYETIVLNFITDAYGNNTAGIRWVELRRQVGEDDFELYQEGTFAPDDGLHRFCGSIAMDGAGNIGLAYNVSGTTQQPTLRFTGRRASDPLGEMTVAEYEFANGNGNSTVGRWGDYAHMAVDPVDDRTFWFTGEFMKFATSWGTRIVAFQVGRDTIDMGPQLLINPVSASLLTAFESVTVEVENKGVETITEFMVGYTVDNGPAVTEMVSQTLNPDETYQHTFATPVDMSAIGAYDFKVFTNLAGDENVLNDTLRTLISNLPRNDIGVTNFFGLNDQLCGDSTLIEIEITNFGTENLTSGTISWDLNGTSSGEIEWIGSLAPGDSGEVDLMLINSQDGNNTLEVTTSMPNGEMDEVPANDQLDRDFMVELEGVTFIFTLETDSHPHETTWQLRDENNSLLYSGGPYAQLNATIVEEWCLDPDLCYVFTIFDNNNDGLSLGEGTYSIVTEYGVEVAALFQQNFGSSENNDFCGTPACMMMADLDITQVTSPGADDGAILISPSSGTPPYLFSINGGNTFSMDGLFTDLDPGTYDILVLDDNDCEFEAFIELIECTMITVSSITHPSEPGATDGSVVVTVINGNNPFMFSIDGGATFQASPLFSGLTDGCYDILTIDEDNCISLQEDVIVGDGECVTAVGEVKEEYTIEVFPNPTPDLFRINITGLSGTKHIPLEVYDASGRLVLHDQLNYYVDLFTGQISLVAFPAGTYFVRIKDVRVNELVKIIKQ